MLVVLKRRLAKSLGYFISQALHAAIGVGKFGGKETREASRHVSQVNPIRDFRESGKTQACLVAHAAPTSAR